MSRRSITGSSEVSVEDTLRRLYGSTGSMSLDRGEEDDFLDADEEEPMAVYDHLRQSENSSSIKDGNESDKADLQKLLPRSFFVYKYPSSGDVDFSLIWLIGNVINAHSSKVLFNKYRKLRNAALNADLHEICENLEKHIPELLRPMSQELAKRYNVNGYNRFNKIGVLVHGLVTILALQLRLFRNELRTSYSNIRKRDLKESTINLVSASSPPTKQINIPNCLLYDTHDPHMSFADFDFSFPGSGSPRKAAGGDFEEEPNIDIDMEPAVSDRSSKSQQASNKEKKQRRQHQRKVNIEKKIWEIINGEERTNANQLREFHLPDNLPFDDGKSFDPTFLPPPDEIPDILVNDQPECLPIDISPKRKIPVEAPMPPPPRKEKRARMQDDLDLEPINEVPTKSPRSRRRRTLTFDDDIQIPAHIFKAGAREVMADSEKRERVNLLRAPNVVPLEGLALIQAFGRKHSARCKDFTAWFMSSENIRAEPDLTNLSGSDASNVPEDPRFGTNVSEIPSVDTTNKSYDKTPQFPQPDGLPSFIDLPQHVDNEFVFAESDVLQPIADDLQQQGGEFDATDARKTFEDIVGPNPSRIDAARTFAMLLRMQAQRKIIMFQDEPYGIIQVQKL